MKLIDRIYISEMVDVNTNLSFKNMLTFVFLKKLKNSENYL